MIKIILASAALSIFYISIHRLHLKWRTDFKPFNCTSCLASWVAVILYFSPELVQNVVFVLFMTGVITPILSHIIENKLWK